MFARKQSIIGLSLVALAVLALAAFAFASRAFAHDTGSVSHGVRHCIEARWEAGFWTGNLSREERQEIRMNFRECVRDVIRDHHSSSSSSSHSSMSGSSLSSSSHHSTGSSLSSSKSSKSSSSKSSKSSVVKVEIDDDAYDPAVVTVKKGTTVRWENEEDESHTVTSDTGGTLVLNSGTLNEDDTYSYTFTNTGTYNYHCQFHSFMHGTVNVTN
jgi:plastocyanin